MSITGVNSKGDSSYPGDVFNVLCFHHGGVYGEVSRAIRIIFRKAAG